MSPGKNRKPKGATRTLYVRKGKDSSLQPNDFQSDLKLYHCKYIRWRALFYYFTNKYQNTYILLKLMLIVNKRLIYSILHTARSADLTLVSLILIVSYSQGNALTLTPNKARWGHPCFTHTANYHKICLFFVFFYLTENYRKLTTLQCVSYVWPLLKSTTHYEGNTH